MQDAATDYLWLLNRGYAQNSSLKLVGDRFRLSRRQRIAISRSICSDAACRERERRRLTAADMEAQILLIDGFNLVVTLEVALAGGVVLWSRDGCYRDLSSMHGSYRRTFATAEAVQLVGQVSTQLRLARCIWYFDQPVSNSGRLATLTNQIADQHGWSWQALTVRDPDQVLAHAQHPIATADSGVLDRSAMWFNLARYVIDHSIPNTWLIHLAEKAADVEHQ